LNHLQTDAFNLQNRTTGISAITLPSLLSFGADAVCISNSRSVEIALRSMSANQLRDVGMLLRRMC
jgi:hypothetical protein